MRAPTVVLLLLLLAGGLPVFPVPEVEAAAPSPTDSVLCGRRAFATGLFGPDWDDYCIFSALELVASPPCRDATFRESQPQARPACDPTLLEVSGESQWELRDSREWTAITAVRFPDWKTLLKEKMGPNVSVRWAFFQMYYDPEYYASRPEMQNVKGSPLFFTEARSRPDDAWTWQNIQDTPGGHVNWSTNAQFHWLRDGWPFNFPAGDFVPPCGSGSTAICKFFLTDWSGFTGNPLRRHLDDAIRGWRTWDHGFVVAHQDFFTASSDPTADEGGSVINDRGTCTDPTHPQFPEKPPQYPPPETIPPSDSYCRHLFRSSSWPGGGDTGPREECVDEWITSIPGLEGTKKWPCWPRLIVHFERNVPWVGSAQIIYNKTRSDLSRPAQFAFSGQAPANLTLDVGDEWGRVTSVTYTVEASVNGVRTVVRRDVPMEDRRLNTSRTAQQLEACQCDRASWWTRAPLDLPPGAYWINFTVTDSDRHRTRFPPAPECSDGKDNDANGRTDFPDEPACTSPEDMSEATGYQAPPAANLVIDERVPTLSAIQLASTDFAQGDFLSFEVNVRSPRTDQFLETVWGEIRSPTSDGSAGTLLRKFRAHPVPGRIDGFRNGVYGGSISWGRGDPVAEPPGTYHLWIRANDTFGRENFSFASAFRVRDIRAPVIDSLSLGAPQTVLAPAPGRGGTYLQEVGGPVTFRVLANDPVNAIPPAVHVQLAATGRAPVQLTLTREANGAYTGSLPAPSEGTWSGRVVARDAEGLEAVVEFTLLSVKPEAPLLRDPTPAAWANITPRIALEVFDLTADPTKVRLFAGEPGALVERQPIVTGQAPLLRVEAPPLGSLRHGRTLQVRVEAIDGLGNFASRTWNVTIDGVPPEPTALQPGEPRTERGGKVYVNGRTPLALAGSDALSGIARIEYRVTDLARLRDGAWTLYEGPFDLAGSDVWRDPGAYRVAWRALDRAGNAETARITDFVVDPAAPALTVRFDGLAFEVEAADPGAGLAEVSVWYRNATEAGWHHLEVPIRDPLAVREKITVAPVPRGDRAYYHALARDRVGNVLSVQSRAAPVEAISPNHPPTLTVTLPAEGAEVSRIVAIPYAAPDADGDPVRVVLEIRPHAVPEPRTLATVNAVGGTLAWNTSEYPDGVYDILVLASDGSATATAAVTVEVRNSAHGVFRPAAPSGRVEFADTVQFSVTLYRPVREAKVVLRDSAGSVVGSVPLRDDGKAGDAVAGDRIFSAAYVPKVKGTLAAQLEVAYENEPVARQDLGTFTVESTLSRALVRNALPIGLGAIVALGVAAAVVVQLTRYGYLFARE